MILSTILEVLSVTLAFLSTISEILSTISEVLSITHSSIRHFRSSIRYLIDFYTDHFISTGMDKKTDFPGNRFYILMITLIQQKTIPLKVKH